MMDGLRSFKDSVILVTKFSGKSVLVNHITMGNFPPDFTPTNVSQNEVPQSTINSHWGQLWPSVVNTFPGLPLSKE